MCDAQESDIPPPQGAFFCTFPEISTTALAPIWTALRKLRKLQGKITAAKPLPDGTRKKLQRRSHCQTARRKKLQRPIHCQTALGELHRRSRYRTVLKKWRKLQRHNRYRTVNMGQKKRRATLNICEFAYKIVKIFSLRGNCKENYTNRMYTPRSNHRCAVRVLLN